MNLAYNISIMIYLSVVAWLKLGWKSLIWLKAALVAGIQLKQIKLNPASFTRRRLAGKPDN